MTGKSAGHTRIALGQSIIARNGPWKFHIGDNPQWANPDFDDADWETVDLTPEAGSFDPTLGVSGYVPGWTAKGNPGYWGYAWYRIRLRVAARRGKNWHYLAHRTWTTLTRSLTMESC